MNFEMKSSEVDSNLTGHSNRFDNTKGLNEYENYLYSLSAYPNLSARHKDKTRSKFSKINQENDGRIVLHTERANRSLP